MDHASLADSSIGMRLQSTADLAPARTKLRDEFEFARIDAGVIDELLLACSELFTNALEAAEPGTEVVAVISITRDPAEGYARRVAVEIVNCGDPVPGRLIVDRNMQIAPGSHRGRGLILAAKMGHLVLEGLVGGTKARLERVVDTADAPCERPVTSR